MDKTSKNFTDEELIELLKNGNHRHFSLLTDRYEKYILNKCKTYVKDLNTAEDLCQEILIKVFLQLPKFRQEAKLTTWLFTITHHTCVDYLRKNKKSVHDVLTEKLSDQVIDIVDFDEELPEEKTMEVLESLLDEITPEGKLILLLKYKEKQHIKDIQLAMGLSESAVKMRLKRAKESLNKLYAAKLGKHSRQ